MQFWVSYVDQFCEINGGAKFWFSSVDEILHRHFNKHIVCINFTDTHKKYTNAQTWSGVEGEHTQQIDIN